MKYFECGKCGQTVSATGEPCDTCETITNWIEHSAMHIIFILHQDYVSFRDSNNRKGSQPTTAYGITTEQAIECLKVQLSIDDNWTFEII